MSDSNILTFSVSTRVLRSKCQDGIRCTRDNFCIKKKKEKKTKAKWDGSRKMQEEPFYHDGVMTPMKCKVEGRRTGWKSFRGSLIQTMWRPWNKVVSQRSPAWRATVWL